MDAQHALQTTEPHSCTIVRRSLTTNDRWSGPLRNDEVIGEDHSIWTLPAIQSRFMQSEVLDDLFNELTAAKKPRGPGKESQRLALCSLLNACFEAIEGKPGEYVGVLWPTATGAEPRSRYRSTLFSPKSRRPVAELLREAGYIDFRRGGRNKESFVPGLTSLVIPTDKLIDFWEEQVSPQPFTIMDDQTAETVVLKDSSKSFVDYQETEATSRQRQVLQELTKVNHGAVWTYETTDGRRRPIPPLSLSLRRVFRERSFERGGRTYCGAQGLTQLERRTVLIDGEDTVELDFRGMSAVRPYLWRLAKSPELSDEIQKELQQDPFEVEGFPRAVIKKAVNTVLNTKSRAAAASALVAEFKQELSMADARSAVDATAKRHLLIADLFFRKKMDAELEYIEAAIMWDAIALFSGWGLPLLPIHDGLLCRAQDADRAEQVLTHAVDRRYGVELVIRRK